MIKKATWIKCSYDIGSVCPEFYLDFTAGKKIKKAVLEASAVGMYIAFINGKRVGNALFAPYWTEYGERTQYQRYDVTDMLCRKNELSFICAEGWAVGTIGYDLLNHNFSDHISLIYSLVITYSDGTKDVFLSGESTGVRTSDIISSQIYDGEVIDRLSSRSNLGFASADKVKTGLIPQIGKYVTEHERIRPLRLIVTPKGERVIDFGQNMAGYVEINFHGAKGGTIALSHAEILDRDGNFYTENLRAAKQQMRYITDGDEVLKPYFTWQGFRYIRLDEYPSDDVDLSDFTAVAVYSDMKRTGYFSCGNSKINQLYSNIIWGQKSNYADVPTDCPQRDERLGWLGDAQVFVRTAAINFDVEKFFEKWLGDLAIGQGKDGEVYGIAPMVNLEHKTKISAAWGDAAVICPWEIYLAYGNKKILENQFDSMKKWIDYIYSASTKKYLWLGGYKHYGDWLAMDGESYMGATTIDYIASAFFAYSTSILIKAGKILGVDMSYYEELYLHIVSEFKSYFIRDGVPVEKTQTAYVLALHFGLCDDVQKTIDGLVEMITSNGMKLSTGFVGTPYILHALSENGREDIAYELLFCEKLPSWLYSVNHGGTTMWEHWDGIREDGSLWSADMNSYNHYAYGSVYDWIFGVCAGIKTDCDGAGYSKIHIEPKTDKRMGFIDASIETRHGRLASKWYYKGDDVYFEFDIPCGTIAQIKLPDGRSETVAGGRYLYTCLDTK